MVVRLVRTAGPDALTAEANAVAVTPRDAGSRRDSFLMKHGVTILFALVALATFRQYGVTWDEPVQSRYGELALHYYTTAGADRSADQFLNLRWYGPLFEMLPAAIYQFAPPYKWEIRHLFIVLAGIAAVAGTGACASLLGVPPFLAQLLLVLTPQFYGAAFNNSKDLPFAAAAIWTMVAMVRLLDQPSLRTSMIAGAVLGLALSIRVGGLLLPGIVFLVLLVSRRRRALIAFAGALLLGWCVMVAAWPSAHRHPFTHPIEAFAESATFAMRIPVLFEGSLIPNDELPRRYLGEMLLLTVPVMTTILAAIGVVIALRRRGAAHLLVAFWLLVPLALFVLMRPNIYDGIRHFLFLLPAIALLAAVGVKGIITRSPANTSPLNSVEPAGRGLFVRPSTLRLRRAGLVLILIASASLTLFDMLRLHPYESAYYNALTGGTAGASGRFDTDYWVSSYREAALWLRRHRRGPVTHVLVAASSYSIGCLRAYLPPGEFAVTRTMDLGLTGSLPGTFDYYVATTRYDLDRNFPASPIVHTVARAGAVFAVIRARERVH